MDEEEPEKLIIVLPKGLFEGITEDASKKRCFGVTETPSVSPRKRRRRMSEKVGVEESFSLNSLDDLLYIAWNYRGDAFDWYILWSMIPALTELRNMVGMTDIKQKIIDLIVYYVQGLHLTDGVFSESDMLHTVLYGSPGTGKTSIARILAKIYCKLGFLKTEKLVVAKRSDFLGKFVGHTEAQTKELLESSLGGVLFIDEAYSLGHGSNTDSFSKAAVDLLNQFLSEHNNEMICIIAGYEKEMNNCFFAINPGLERRFPWKFKIKGYTASETQEMFERKVVREGWAVNDKAISKTFFKDNLKAFPFFGGDINNFFTFCKTAHSRRIFGNRNASRKTFNRSDIEKGFKLFSKKDSEKIDHHLSHYL